MVRHKGSSGAVCLSHLRVSIFESQLGLACHGGSLALGLPFDKFFVGPAMDRTFLLRLHTKQSASLSASHLL